uniref:Secreted protein n=1 Tax=Macrostomum lignano TaxID=282301 RepID=A0A1I8IMN3_9PLAT
MQIIHLNTTRWQNSECALFFFVGTNFCKRGNVDLLQKVQLLIRPDTANHVSCHVVHNLQLVVHQVLVVAQKCN